ncbi:MAG: MFS transporter [Novosphingobium sp.]
MRPNHNAIISAVFLVEVSATFETSMLYAALPTLIRTFGDPITAGWLVTIHMLIGTVACIVAGRLGDMYGRRKVMLILLALAALGSLISALTTNFGMVLAGRALQGFASAAIPLSIGILREALPEKRLPVAVGLMTTAQGMGVAVGLVLGGVIIDHLNWHWLFVISGILLVISYAVIRLIVPPQTGIPPKEKIDWIEGLLPAPGIGAVLLGLSLSKTYGWFDPRCYALVAVGALLLAIWAQRSLRAREPFINLRLLGERNIAVANFAAVLLGLGSAQIVFVFSTYMQAPAWTLAGLGFSATLAGFAKLPSNVLSFFAGPLSGWLALKHSARVPILVGGVMAALGWVVGMTLPNTLIQMIGLLCLISFGTSLLNAALPIVIVGASPADRTSEAIGAMSVIRGMCGAVGVQMIALVLATDMIAAPIGGALFPSPASYRLTMAVIAALTVAAGLTGLLLAPQKVKRPAETLAVE